MKKFFYKEEVIKTSRMYGYSIIRCTIYQLKKDNLTPCGFTDYCTASTMGGVSEVHKHLIDNGYLKKSLVKMQQKNTDYVHCKDGFSYYYYGSFGDQSNKKYNIEIM